jgi:hypothetical protein
MNGRQTPGTPESGAQDVQRFEMGRAAGHYRQQTSASVDRITITTGNSPWLGIRCLTCNQTFRRGDRVLLNPPHSTQHLDPNLQCASNIPNPGEERRDSLRAAATAPVVAAALSADDAAQFTAGLLDTWPPINRALVIILTERNWQVTKPSSGPASPVCPGCGHTFRAGDTVIICPCAEAPDDMRYASCQLAVHRDPAAGLACWDDWCPDGRLKRCPRTYEKLPD